MVAFLGKVSERRNVVLFPSRERGIFLSKFIKYCIIRSVIHEEIQKFFKGEVEYSKEVLAEYSRDASIFEVMPEVVVFPKDREDIKNLVKFVFAEKKKGRKISISARSAGTCMSGGPLTESIVVNFTRHLNSLVTVGEDFVVVEPGLFYRELERILDEKGMMLPSYPASKSLCALGGMISNNSGGEKTLAYGKTEKYVEELKVILEDGEEHTFSFVDKNMVAEKIKAGGLEGKIYQQMNMLLEHNKEKILSAKPRVSKNSAGYEVWNCIVSGGMDLSKIFVGAQGTLGIITEAKLKVIPRKKHSGLAVVFLKNVQDIPKLAKIALKFNPESIESFDDNTLKIALKFFTEIIRKMKARNFFRLAFAFIPEALMVLTGGIPKMIVLIELTDDNKKFLDSRLSELRKEIRAEKFKIRIIYNPAEAEKYWTMRRESFNLLRSKFKDKQTAPFIDDFIVAPEKLGEFLPQLYLLLDPYKEKMTYTVAGHIGDGNFHIIPLVNLDDEEVRRSIPILMDLVYNLVLKFGGSITAEHNDGLIRSPFLERMYGREVYRIFEEIKQIFDSEGIFNPGKKVGSNLQYALNHIKSK